MGRYLLKRLGFAAVRFDFGQSLLYLQAAQSLGAGSFRILTVHLIPACAGHLLVQATLLLPAFILAEATLSFIGLGC